jgi:hypothetical protein
LPGCALRSPPTTRGADVALVSKLHPTRSHSGAAEGGINAALGNAGDDTPEAHAFDTVKGSDFLGDQDAIEAFTDEAPADIYELEAWGCIFSRDEAGKIAQRPFGAAANPRAVYAADITGHVLLHVCYEQAAQAGNHGVRGMVRVEARRRRRPLPGRHLLGHSEGGPSLVMKGSPVRVRASALSICRLFLWSRLGGRGPLATPRVREGYQLAPSLSDCALG